MKLLILIVIGFLSINVPKAFAEENESPMERLASKYEDSTVSQNAEQEIKALTDAESKNSIGSKLQDEISKLDIGFCLNHNFFNKKSAGLGIGYCYDVQPSYNQSLYQRTDSINLNFDTGDWIKKRSAKLEISQTDMVSFIRQFKTQKEALLALPYLPNRIPLTAKRAIERMSPGDFFSFDTNLTFLASLNPSQALGHPLRLEESVYFLVSGGFKVKIFRMKDNKINVELIGIRHQESGQSIGVAANTGFKITGIHFWNKQLHRVFDATGIFLDHSSPDHDTFSAEYIVDLTNSNAANAYNTVILNAVKAQPKEAFNISVEEIQRIISLWSKESSQNTERDIINKLSSRLKTVLTPLDVVFDEDVTSHAANKRVDRLFQGIISSRADNSQIRINLLHWVFRYLKSGYSSSLPITVIDEHNRRQGYIFNIFTDTDQFNILFSLRNTSEVRDLHSLFKADHTGRASVFEGLGINYQYNAKELTLKKGTSNYAQLKQALPDPIMKGLDAEITRAKWDLSKAHSVVRMRHEIVFKSETLETALKSVTVGQLTVHILNHLQYLESINALPLVQAKNVSGLTNYVANGPYKVYGNYKKYDGDAYEIAVRLWNLFSTKVTDPEMANSEFEGLKRMALFDELGTGILMSLIPQDKLEGVVFVHLVWSANDVGSTVDYVYGKNPNGFLYDKIRKMLAVFQNATFDINNYKQYLP